MKGGSTKNWNANTFGIWIRPPLPMNWLMHRSVIHLNQESEKQKILDSQRLLCATWKEDLGQTLFWTKPWWHRRNSKSKESNRSMQGSIFSCCQERNRQVLFCLLGNCASNQQCRLPFEKGRQGTSFYWSLLLPPPSLSPVTYIHNLI